MFLGDVTLEQVSDALVFKPEPVPVIRKKTLEITGKDLPVEFSGKLPSDKEYYVISMDLDWKDYKGESELLFEWMTDESGDIIATDRCAIRSMEGVLPQWNGIIVQWKRNGSGYVGFVSRKLDKLFNENDKGGEGQNVYRVDKPEGAEYLSVKLDEPQNTGGALLIKEIEVSGEY
jgi:hypothetical protein